MTDIFNLDQIAVANLTGVAFQDIQISKAVHKALVKNKQIDKI